MRKVHPLWRALVASAWFAASIAHAASPGDLQSLEFGGRTRSYLIRLPPGPIANGARVPLVIVMHGGGGNAANAEHMTGFTAKARAEGFIVVYPNGTGPLEGTLLTWNDRHCCAYAMNNDVDDVGFIRALIDALVANYPVDPHRVYATGMSNGGMMSHRLGIELSDKLAAIAPVVGTVFGDEKTPPHPVPALIINGLLDEHVPWQGGPPGGRGARGWDGTPTQPAIAQLEFWERANGCKPEPVKQDADHWTLWLGNCPAHEDVELYLLKDQGHAWPGGEPGSARGDTPSPSLNATDVIWDFFKAHVRP